MFKLALAMAALAAAQAGSPAAALPGLDIGAPSQPGRHMLKATLRAASDQPAQKISRRPRALLGGINKKSLSTASGIDTAGSTAPYGGCDGVSPSMSNSHWCQKGGVPGNPTDAALKYGRQTIYGPGGRGWCGNPLSGGGDAVPVAISTKYIPLEAVSPNSAYCGQCVCVRTRGCDTIVNPHPPGEAEPYYGKVFKGQVADLCPECAADSIDVLAASPYFDAVPSNIAYAVGVWTVEWNFVDCSADCSTFFAY